MQSRTISQGGLTGTVTLVDQGTQTEIVLLIQNLESEGPATPGVLTAIGPFELGAFVYGGTAWATLVGGATVVGEYPGAAGPSFGAGLWNGPNPTGVPSVGTLTYDQTDRILIGGCTPLEPSGTGPDGTKTYGNQPYYFRTCGPDQFVRITFTVPHMSFV